MKSIQTSLTLVWGIALMAAFVPQISLGYAGGHSTQIDEVAYDESMAEQPAQPLSARQIQSLLGHAIIANNVSLVKTLVAEGADLRVKDVFGFDALTGHLRTFPTREGCGEMTWYLIEAGGYSSQDLKDAVALARSSTFGVAPRKACYSELKERISQMAKAEKAAR